MKDTILATLVFGTIFAGFLTALIGTIKSFRNGKDIDKVHLLINSRLDELLLLTKRASYAEGVIQGEINKTDQNDTST